MTELEIGLTIAVALLVVLLLLVMYKLYDTTEMYESNEHRLEGSIKDLEDAMDSWKRRYLSLRDSNAKKIKTILKRMEVEELPDHPESSPRYLNELRMILNRNISRKIIRNRVLESKVRRLEEHTRNLEDLLDKTKNSLNDLMSKKINPPVSSTAFADAIGRRKAQLEAVHGLNGLNPTDCFFDEMTLFKNTAPESSKVDQFRKKVFSFKSSVRLTGADTTGLVSGTLQVRAINLDEAVAFVKGELDYKLTQEFYVNGKEKLLKNFVLVSVNISVVQQEAL